MTALAILSNRGVSRNAHFYQLQHSYQRRAEMNDDDAEFAKDLLRGAEEIAQFLYGGSSISSLRRTCLCSSWAQ